MSLKQDLEADILQFFEQTEKLTVGDKRKALKILMEKYIHLSTADCLLDKHDFEMIKDHAHRFYINSAFPKKVGSNRREISSYEANALAIIEGTIQVLNGKDCLKKLAKFDYRD
jgi:hypothetical protein